MWCVKALILLLSCSGYLAGVEEKPYFMSRNFNNVLHWEPAIPDTPGEEVVYSVQYRRFLIQLSGSINLSLSNLLAALGLHYAVTRLQLDFPRLRHNATTGLVDEKDQMYQKKVECQNITTLSCDLTAETPAIPDVHYNARVTANGHDHGQTYRFKPIAKTVLGPPILSLSTTFSSLHVNVTLPLGANGVSILDTFNHIKRLSFTSSTLYILNITRPKWAAQVNMTVTGQFAINLKNNNTEYCGYVVYMPTVERGRPPSENTSFCVKLPGNPWMLFPWYFLAAASLAVSLIAAVACYRHYVDGGKNKKMPNSLAVTSFNIHPQRLQSPDRSLCISKLEILHQNDQKVHGCVPVKLKLPVVEPGGYTPQAAPCQQSPWNIGSSLGIIVHSPPPDLQDASNQSSSYSAVVVHAPGEETEGFLSRQTPNGDRGVVSPPSSSLPSKPYWDTSGTNPKLMSNKEPHFLDYKSQGGNTIGPQLHTVRDKNGRLQLSLFGFQSQSAAAGQMLPSTSEEKTILDTEEGAPLLSLRNLIDPEGSDSGCESTVNSPTQISINSDDSPIQCLLPTLPEDSQSSQTRDSTCNTSYMQNWVSSNFAGKTPQESCGFGMTSVPLNFLTNVEEEREEIEDREQTVGQMILGSWVVQIGE